MAAYIARRLIWMVFLLFVIALITFVIFSVLPAGDPAVARAGRQPSPEAIELIRERFGLDDPKHIQFINYIADLLPFLGGNGVYFGFSYQNSTDVLPEILKRLPVTLYLTTGAVVLWLAIGIPLGVLTAVKSGTWIDKLAMGVALIFISAPVYFLGLVVLFLFDDQIGKFPLLPGNSAYDAATGFLGKAETLILPWCVLAAAFAAIYARLLRSTMREALAEDYVRTARAKGLAERRVIMKHAFRNALIPLATVVALNLGAVIGGAVVTETVFSLDGMGLYFINNLVEGDPYPVMAWLMITAVMIVFFNLVADVLYGFLDPRVRYD